MPLNLNQVQKDIEKMESRLIQIRQEIHMHPELGFEEVRTSQLVAEELKKVGLDVQTGVAKTGVVAILKGSKPGPTIAFRADMDALSMEDKKDVPYASKVKGKAHTCGHDVHTTILLGTALVLSEYRDQISGQVKFIFQPAEEGPGGAEPMIEEGALDGVDVIYGLHTWHHGEVGEVEIVPGPSSASADEIEIIIKGKGGHGAYPHETVDAIHLSGLILTALHTLPSRFIDPLEPNVITIGKINGGYRRNIIADKVELSGTVRTYNDDLRQQIKEQIEKVLKGITHSFGGDYELDYNWGYPPLINHLNEVERFSKVVKESPYPFKELVRKPAMGGEDFAYFLQKIPGAFFYLGTKGSDASSYPGHHPLFDVDERCIGLGVLLFAGLVKDFFNK
ncbi:MAG: amidohydrolase [Halanaerobiales bacterium]|nr:amidohydrolase [Halanaerobiales bacterium]